MRLYAESSKCSGCRACLLACSLNLFTENNPKKGALAILPHFPAPGVYEVKVCTQCGDCAKACPTDAITADAQGIYRVDPAKCNLCEACVPACTEGVMFAHGWMAPAAWKCDSCGDCVAVCGTNALRLGEIKATAKAGA